MKPLKLLNTLTLTLCKRGSWLGFGMMMLSSCASLLPAPPPAPAFYAIEGLATAKPALSPASTIDANKATLIIHTPHAASGYATQHIMYQRQPHQLEYYAQSEWVAPPANMLAPLMLQAITQGGQFAAVVMAPSHVVADYRLETEIIRLHQSFVTQPSQMHLKVRAALINNVTRKVVAVREFDEVANASSENAYGGVKAANAVVQTFLDKLTAFCRESALPLK